ncbi:MAG: DUF1634 domain-containing protein [Myxococcales bacterium]|nr:DUF1634 domain-containing protein [Myxococcales bacterium]
MTGGAGPLLAGRDAGGAAARWVGALLATGVTVAAACLAAGLLMAPSAAGPLLAPVGPTPEVLARAMRAEPTGLMNLGVLVLIATPVLGVAALGVGFAARGERRYVLSALAVLAMLIVGAWLGGVR